MKLPNRKADWKLNDYIKYLTPKKYKSSGEFKKGSHTVYIYASKGKLIDKIRNHFGWIKRREIYSAEKALKMARKFKNVQDWKNSEHYDKTANKKLILSVMKWNIHYTFEECLKSTKNIQSVGQWRAKKRKFHDTAIMYGWETKIFAEKGWIVKKKQTHVAVLRAAFNAKSMEDLKKKNKAAYERIENNGWAKDIFAKTANIKTELLKEGLNRKNKVEENVFPMTARLKKVLADDFWNKKTV